MARDSFDRVGEAFESCWMVRWHSTVSFNATLKTCCWDNPCYITHWPFTQYHIYPLAEKYSPSSLNIPLSFTAPKARPSNLKPPPNTKETTDH